MNSMLTFLRDNWHQFGLHRYGSPLQMTSVIITPRFHASSHVVFLIMRQEQADPVLVAKVPRLAGEGTTLVREAANLRTIQANREGGYGSIPRVIAFERHWDRPVLVETALVGRPLDPPAVQRDPIDACQEVIEWLVKVQSASRASAASDSDWYTRLISEPFSRLERNMSLTSSEQKLFERTRRLAESLKAINLPLVVEHGDLSHPNLIMLEGNGGQVHPGIGVVDWELAEVRGLPGCDLFFFLTYVAFALSKARENRRHVEAFHGAFFGGEPWTRAYIRQYAQKMELDAEALPALLVLTWARYLAGLLARLEDPAAPSVELKPKTIAWLRDNRYFALWRHTIEHLEELNWHW